MLDDSRRDDIGWLVATYDQLVAQPAGPLRDDDLARVQRWLCRVTGMTSLSGAVAAARRLTHHEIGFVSRVPSPDAARDEPDDARSTRRRARHHDRPAGHQAGPEHRAPAPPLTEEVAAELQGLLDRLDGVPRRTRTAAEDRQADDLRRRISELTGMRLVETARTALRTFLARRDGLRRFVPTKPYAEGRPRTPPPITVVHGGSPGGGSRA